jgi:uncharacterized protein (TIGR02231 family)
MKKNTKFILVIAWIMSLFNIPLAAASELTATSEVSKVTLYLDRAEITRKATVLLEPGTNQIFLRGIPQSVAAESLRASGQGAKGTSILGVELKEIPLRDDYSVEIKELTEKIAALNFENDSLTRSKESLEKQRDLLTSLELNQPVPEGEKIIRPRSPKEISELMTLLNEGSKKIEVELKSIQQAADKIKREMEFTNAKLSTLQAPRKNETAIAVSVAAEKEGNVNLEVSYQVNEASWRPAYNLNENNLDFSLDTFALITQKSGEDWSNVNLTLSTARPQIRLERPDPDPFMLDIFQNYPAKPYQKEKSLSNMEERAGAVAFKKMAGALKDEETDAKEPMADPAAEVNLGAVVTYNISHPITLKSDGTTEKVKVTTSSLKGTVSNVMVPVLSLDVYREALLTNISDLPLLPGTMNIFSDSKFLGSRNMPLTQAGEEIRESIGASQNVTVKRTLLKKYEDDSGIVRSVHRVRHDYLIEVKNNSSLDQTAAVLEPAPLSRNEKISVSFDNIDPPRLPSDSKDRIKNQEGIMEWHFKLAPKEKKEIKYSSIVEYPDGISVAGIANIN